MPLRVNPIILLGFIIAFILSLGILAGAQLGGGGTAGDAIGVGEAQIGKPWQMATDGPNAFSCAGLMRYIMRTIGVDGDAPFSPEGYLGRYAPVSLDNLQPGDIVIYPDWATMYVGNGMLLNSNQALGYVTHTPMSEAGAPEGAVRPPYGGGQSQGEATQPQNQATDPLTQPQNGAVDPLTQPLNQATDQLAQPPLNGGVDPSAQPPQGDATTLQDQGGAPALQDQGGAPALQGQGDATLQPQQQF